MAESGLVMTGAGPVIAAPTSRVRVALPVPPAFVAIKVTENVPRSASPGVPVMSPVAVLIVNDPGKPVAPKLAGELVAVI